MKLPYTKVKFYPEVKSQTGLSSLRVSRKRALIDKKLIKNLNVNWFLKIWLSIPLSVWIKNGITQCMELLNKFLLADLMMMVFNRNKTDGG